MSSPVSSLLEEDDAALLVLIHQHLRVKGFLEAAEMLEKHVPQVETTHESFNLHEIYTGWMKLCSPAQAAKQETEDSDTSKKNGIEPEAATTEEGLEECAHAEVSIITEDEVDVKLSLELRAEGVESAPADLTCTGDEAESVSEQPPDAAGEIKTATNLDDKRVHSSDSEGEKGEMEKKSPPAEVFAEASNDAESCDDVAASQNDPEQDGAQAAELTEACGSDGERREETKRDGDEPEQEPEETMDPTNVTAETSVSQTEVTLSCTQEEDDKEDSAAKPPGSAESSSSDLTAHEANEQLAESEAPPPADPDSESAEEKLEKKEQISEGGAATSPSTLEGQVEMPTSDPHITETVMVEAAAERADPEDSIILNIQVEDGDAAERETSQLLPEEAAQSCNDFDPLKKKNRKKKKRSKKEMETAPADSLAPDKSTSTSETLSDAPLSSCSAKKKRGEKMRQEEVAEEDTSQVAPSEKKVGKKRRRERDKVEEEDVETPVVHSENKRKKKKKVKYVEKEESNVGKVENPESLTETEGKKKKKRKKREQETEEQCDEQPAGGNKDTQEKLDTTDGNSSQTSSAKKKHRLRKKLSLKKRLRLHKKDERRKKRRHNGQTKKKMKAGEYEETTERPPAVTESQDPPVKKKKKKRREDEVKETEPAADDNTPTSVSTVAVLTSTSRIDIVITKRPQSGNDVFTSAVSTRRQTPVVNDAQSGSDCGPGSAEDENRVSPLQYEQHYNDESDP
ncbi:hypothetical protein EXN66_Car014255 [Channa argus]|uniref:Uncharacterized protein n=1 Tax=Channa argus TaxID=215402 RepID=A0A6G1Q8G5_CHAAH|nr:hypothetical protein EXN66_Car014255 [Channa argus]